MSRMEEPLKLFQALCVLSSVPWLKQWPYSWILCKICLTSLTWAFPSHNLSTVLFGECDSLALYLRSVFYTIMCNHTNTCTLTHTVFSDGVSEWYSWCGLRVERETVDQTWVKVRIKLCPMKMISFLNGGKPWWILWNTKQWQGTPTSSMIIIS